MTCIFQSFRSDIYSIIVFWTDTEHNQALLQYLHLRALRRFRTTPRARHHIVSSAKLVMSFYLNAFFAAVHFAMNSFLAAAQSNFAGVGAAAE